MYKLKNVRVLLIAMFVIMVYNIFCNVLWSYANTDEENLAIDKVNVLGVMVGTDNGFEEEANLTRAQAAAIMVRLKGFDEAKISAQTDTSKSAFKDVSIDHWAIAYVNVASLYNLVSGTGEGNFEPNNNVKIIELCAMISRVLGAGNMINASGNWPDNYYNFAKREGLLDGITSDINSSATRLETAKIISNALDAQMWKTSSVTSNGKVNYERETSKVLLDSFMIKKYINEHVDNVDKDDKTITFRNYNDDEKSELEKYSLSKNIKVSDYTKDMNVEAWVNTSKDEIVLLKELKDTNKKGDKIRFTSIKKYVSDSKRITITNSGEDTIYYFADSLTQDEYRGTYNGNKLNLTEICSLLDEKKSDGKLTELMGSVIIKDSKILWIDFGSYSNIGIVSEVSSSKIYFNTGVEGANAAKYIKATASNSEVVNLDGKVISFDGISEGFIVKYYLDESTNTYYILTYLKCMLGTVTSRSSKYIYLDEEKYAIASSAGFSLPSVDDDIKIYLNENNEVIMYTDDEELVWLVEADEIDYSDNEDDSQLEEVSDSNLQVGFITSAVGSTVNRKKVLKLGITAPNGKEIVKYVNLDKMYKLFPDKFDDKSILQEEIINLYVGTWVKYRVENAKYVLYQFGSYVYDGLTKDVVNVESAKFVESSNKIGTYLMTDSTKLYVTSTYLENNLNKTASLEAIDMAQLSDAKKYDFTAAGIDGNKLAYVTVFAGTSDLEGVEGCGVLANYVKNSDSTYTLNIVTSMGTRTYKVSDSVISKSSLIIGSLLEYTIQGTSITKARVTLPELSNDASRKVIKAKIINIYDDAVNLKLEDNTRELYYTKNLVYADATISGSSELTIRNVVGTSKKPATISASSKYDSSEGTIVYCYLVKENGEYMVRAIIY